MSLSPLDAPAGPGAAVDAPVSAPSPAVAARRAALTRAALTVLQREGYAAVTARKIAAEAGMSLGHITYHFKDMAGLMAAAFVLAARQLLQADPKGAPRPAASARDRLAALLKAAFAPDQMHPDNLRLRIDLWSAALTRPEIAASEAALHGELRARIEALLMEMSHYSRRDRVPGVCDVMMATLDGLWLDYMRRRDPKATARGLEMCQKLAALELS